MPVKTRTPKGREFKVSEEMIDLFQRGRALQAQIESREDKLREVQCRLNKLCNLLPWDQSVLDVLDVQHVPREGNLHDQSGKKVLAIRQAIEAALEEGRARRKAAGEAHGEPSV
jgi:hypothetical protein